MSDQAEKVNHGWFSQKAVAAGSGLFIYLNKDGKEVRVSAVTPTMSDPFAWDDSVYVGEVVRFEQELIPAKER